MARLIRPKLSFAAALNGFTTKDGETIELQIERCVVGKLWVARSVTAQWVLNIGLECHPGFIMDLEALQFRRRLRKIAEDIFWKGSMRGDAWKHKVVTQGITPTGRATTKRSSERMETTGLPRGD